MTRWQLCISSTGNPRCSRKTWIDCTLPNRTGLGSEWDIFIINFVDNLIGNICLGQQLSVHPEAIPHHRLREFSNEVKQHFKWTNALPLQMQQIDLQAPRKCILEGLTLPPSGSKWSLRQVADLREEALYILTVFGSTYSCEADFFHYKHK